MFFNNSLIIFDAVTTTNDSYVVFDFANIFNEYGGMQGRTKSYISPKFSGQPLEESEFKPHNFLN